MNNNNVCANVARCKLEKISILASQLRILTPNIL